jgi:4-amino-4-deoxychorismate lyase
MFAKYLTDEGCDIIIIKNGLVTDTSFSNICFYDGTRWLTPAKPLLKGTMRAYLLSKNLIIEKDISVEIIKSYKKLRFINAFNGFENPFELEISAIMGLKGL